MSDAPCADSFGDVRTTQLRVEKRLFAFLLKMASRERHGASRRSFFAGTGG